MISEEELSVAARAYEQYMISCLPEPDECEAVFSSRFERRMKRLIFQTDHPFHFWLQKSAASLLLIVLLGGCGLFAFNTNVRASFLGWIQEIYDTYFLYRYEGQDQGNLGNIVYRPAWVPDGYEIIQETIGPVNANIIYQNSNGELLALSYSINSESTTYRVDRENAEVQHVFVGDIPADLYFDPKNDGGNVLVWADAEKGAIFDIWAIFGADEMIRMAESIEENKNF